MGLIKKDYQYKGYTLSTAYARAQVDTEDKKVVFYIGANRDLAFVEPIEKITMYNVPFTHVRNPFEEAYEFGKGSYEEDQGDGEVIIVNRFFADWENDIVE
jgi:hypothetical protein